jgi:UDP-2,3-diacylglucosamine hydrolase
VRKLGLIAGGGSLPVSLARHCRDQGRALFVVRLTGFADSELSEFAGADVPLGRLGAAIDALRAAGCEAVCLAGKVARPDFRSLRPDLRGIAALPGALAAAREGENGLLAFLLAEFEKEGFIAEGAHEVMSELILKPGPLGRRKPGRVHQHDIAAALAAARAVGALDAGQGAVVCDGLILALEAQEGTDAMLARVAGLPAEIRGTPQRRRGVLAKACKPRQERRVDLPTIGPETVRGAAAAGLAGVVGDAGLTLVVERDQVRALADDLGLFVIGAT